MTPNVTSNAAASFSRVILDTDTLAALNEGVQLELADQVNGGLIALAKAIRERVADALARDAVAAELRTRRNGDDPAGRASLGTSLAEASLLLAELNESGASASAPPSYLWLEKSTSVDANGNPMATWSASWQTQKLSEAVDNGTVKLPDGSSLDPSATFDAADWSIAATDPDAALLLADSATPPTACSAASSGDITYYCFEANPNIIVTNDQLTQWGGALDALTAKDVSELERLNQQADLALESYGQMLKDARDTPADAGRLSDVAAAALAQATREATRRRDLMLDDNARNARSEPSAAAPSPAPAPAPAQALRESDRSDERRT